MRVKYIGPTFGAFSLTSNKVYECLGVECDGRALLVIDDEGPDYWEKRDDEPDGYLYSVLNPRPLDGSSPGGRWEVVEDDEFGTLAKAIRGELIAEG
ncbi:MAG: hypothetical protein LBT60_07630 [Oscillospiraceae bacterium]|nr:hypothetical protein [Oscillospiraceae bacterium]